MTRGRFGKIMEDAIAEIPQALRGHLGEVVFVVGQFLSVLICVRLLGLVLRARGRTVEVKAPTFPKIAPETAERSLVCQLGCESQGEWYIPNMLTTQIATINTLDKTTAVTLLARRNIS